MVYHAGHEIETSHSTRGVLSHAMSARYKDRALRRSLLFSEARRISAGAPENGGTVHSTSP